MDRTGLYNSFTLKKKKFRVYVFGTNFSAITFKILIEIMSMIKVIETSAKFSLRNKFSKLYGLCPNQMEEQPDFQTYIYNKS